MAPAQNKTPGVPKAATRAPTLGEPIRPTSCGAVTIYRRFRSRSQTLRCDTPSKRSISHDLVGTRTDRRKQQRRDARVRPRTRRGRAKTSHTWAPLLSKAGRRAARRPRGTRAAPRHLFRAVNPGRWRRGTGVRGDHVSVGAVATRKSHVPRRHRLHPQLRSVRDRQRPVAHPRLSGPLPAPKSRPATRRLARPGAR